jgi:maleylacetoacetate isomerase
VRIALNLKNVDYESRPVNLLTGEQNSDEYRALNPLGLVPMLEIDGQKLTQSLAIINYLDIRYPVPPLIPASAAERAHVVALAMMVACDIHPLNNLSVLKYLKSELGQPQEKVDAWYRHWISARLPALEEMAKPRAGDFMFGNGPTGADVLLVPQLYNARRYEVPLEDFPTLLRAEENANKLDAFAEAHPDRQQVPA